MLTIVGERPPRSGVAPFEGGTGARLGRLFEIPIEVLRRRAWLLNLAPYPGAWDPDLVNRRAMQLAASPQVTTMLLCGRRVAEVFGCEEWLGRYVLPRALPVVESAREPTDEERCARQLPPVVARLEVAPPLVMYAIPHPSGRNRWYNEPEHRALVMQLCRKLAIETGVLMESKGLH